MGKDRRVIYRNGKEFGEIVEDPYGKKIVRNVYGEDVREIEEDIAGNESIVAYDGDKKRDFGRIEFDPYRGKEVIRRNDGKEDEEIEYEPTEDDSEFSRLCFSLLDAALSGWRVRQEEHQVRIWNEEKSLWEKVKWKKEDKKETDIREKKKKPPKPKPWEADIP